MFTKSKDHNPNYLASVVALKNVRKHSNADRLLVCTIYANNIITSLSAKEGALYVYFPLESAISKEFLSFTNSFEDKTLNKDTNVKGYFSSHGRVRATNFRGEKSEGYVVPVAEFEQFAKAIYGIDVKFTDANIGVDFDEFCGKPICKKYVPANSRTPGAPGSKKSKGNVKRYISKLVEKQFAFHPDTSHLKREVNKIKPTDLISICNKIHGCNFVVANVLIKRKLNWKEKAFKFCKLPVKETEYGMLYSSRAVIKNASLNDDKENNHFYDADIWKIVADRLYPSLKEGITAYGEIYGYTPTGKFIQKDYDYGMEPGKLDFVVFRLTYTNTNGDVFEFNHNQVQEYCKKFDIKTPETYYYGYAQDLFPELINEDMFEDVDYDVQHHWHENFLAKMMEKYLEKDCHLCKVKPNTPAEGVILRNDSKFDWEVYKLKSFRFLKKESDELDKGEIDMESAEAIAEEVL